MNHPILALKYLTHFVIVNRSMFSSLSKSVPVNEMFAVDELDPRQQLDRYRQHRLQREFPEQGRRLNTGWFHSYNISGTLIKFVTTD